MKIADFISRVAVFFDVLPDKEDEGTIVAQISSGVTFRGANLWILIFAIFIASLGLNVNSTAVIIGAMLISPLMGPIIGIGLAVGINDLELLKRAARNFGLATLISVLTAMVYFLITPLGEAQSELLARTSPTIYDVLIATCGGAAGFVALCTRGKGNVIPGVAIATALMPPLCTAGYGLATGHFLYFLGAFYLFFINTVFISLATYAGVRLLHFHRREFSSPVVARRTQRVIMGVAVVTMLPAAVMTAGIVRKSIFDNKLNRFLKTELTQVGTQIVSTDVDEANAVLRVVAVGREIPQRMQAEASRRMESYGLGGYQLSVFQGEQSDSILRLSQRLTQLSSGREGERKQLAELSARAASLSEQLQSYTRYEALCVEMRPECQALFPQVQTLGLSKVAEVSRDTTLLRRYVVATVGVDARKRLSPAEQQRFSEWLQARVKADSLVVFWAIVQGQK